MIVYRISHAEFAQLKPSGRLARWNTRGKQILYAAESRSLACLENVVHRGSEGLNLNFKVLLISITFKIQTLNVKKLAAGWDSLDYTECQKHGDAWLESGTSAVLKVPSVIIPGEFNYLINTNHSDFNRLTYTLEDFRFDERIKKEPF